MTIAFSKIEGSWSGQIVYIVGGGPSLMNFDLRRIESCGILIGANKSAFDARCQVLFTMDQHFLRRSRTQIAEFVERGGEAVLCVPPNENQHQPVPGATYVYRRRNPGLSDDPSGIYGNNSGYGALGLAYLRRPSKIALLGFDFKYDEDGNTHWHGGYSWHSRSNNRFMHRWAEAFDRAAMQLDLAGIEVINFIGPEGSNLRHFPTASLDDL